VEPEPEPEPATLIVVPEPEPAPEPQPEEPPATEPEPFAPVPELTVVEPEHLPDFVVEPPDEIPPVVVPEPEPEPDLSGPLPEFVVEPGADAPAPVARIEPALEPEEEEEDLGPLPDFVIDPNDPDAARRPPPPPPAEPTPILAPRVVSPEEKEPETPTLNFPSSTAFSIPRGSRDDVDEREPRTPRRRPPAELGKPKRSNGPAEPGDDVREATWMEGLSNRLSAYSLSEDDEPPAAEDSESPPE
jgi:fused signal recognition particle receptor